ncbi:MAG: quinone oxidoreductase [Methylocystis sp.]|jgi:NADPH2:quinone reductase|nr:quinone oxidoreductase [Methylocystis sp.]MCA3588856.1 quinone oxidoreductase [Methylocystis sp.]MCA3590847.1 quinone oxidoreductase [Methylocystis sp.]
MKAIVFQEPGRLDPDMLREIAVPSVQTGEVLVRVACAGLNFADMMMRSGTYPHPKGYPLVAGLEMAGEIVQVGQGVTAFAPGDRVAAFSENAGAFAEYCAVPEERLIRLPASIGYDTGAAAYIQATTAWNLLHTMTNTQKGDVVLIHAIGGGVGLYLTQFAKKAGATVIGTVGTRGKESRALAYGADLVINREEHDFVAEVMRFTAGRGVDKVIDSVGASTLDRSFDTIRRLGHVVSYGEAEGKPWPNLWERLVAKSLTFGRMHLGHLDYRSPAWMACVDAVVTDIVNGSLQVPIERIFPMAEADAMFAALASRTISGKLLLDISGEFAPAGPASGRR